MTARAPSQRRLKNATLGMRYPWQKRTKNVPYHKPLSDFNMILFLSGKKGDLRECVKNADRGGPGEMK